MSIQDAVGVVRSVYVRPPDPTALGRWRAFGWRSAPDPAAAIDEHTAFRELLTTAGAEVVVGATRLPGDPDAIYTYDPTLPTDRGLIVLRPGKPGRRDESAAVGADLAAHGIAVVGTLEAPATAEGGDMCWLDRRTLAVGRGYRTNDAGIEQLRGLLGPDVDVLAFDLPHFEGPDTCLHLLSFVSLLDRDLAVAFLPMAPVRLLEALRDRDVRLVEVPEEEFGSQGPNVLALAPRVALALDGNPETRRRMEAAGVDVRTYRGDHISRRGDGGPTCLTRPLDRG